MEYEKQSLGGNRRKNFLPFYKSLGNGVDGQSSAKGCTGDSRPAALHDKDDFSLGIGAVFCLPVPLTQQLKTISVDPLLCSESRRMRFVGFPGLLLLLQLSQL